MKLNGLVLAGGRSSRLGTDKATLKWHGIPQWQYLADLISNPCETVCISWRTDSGNYEHISDSIENIGPIGGIHSAFLKTPDRPWLVLACDMPFIDLETIQKLVSGIDSSYSVIYGYNKEKDQKEPAIAVWMPDSAQQIELNIAQGNYQLQNMLKDGKPILLSEEKLFNVNTLEDYFLAKKKLPYLPIDCNYYDHVEAAALHPQATITYFDLVEFKTVNAHIKTTEIKNHEEYLLLQSGEKIRMDMIESINSVPNPKQ